MRQLNVCNSAHAGSNVEKFGWGGVDFGWGRGGGGMGAAGVGETDLRHQECAHGARVSWLGFELEHDLLPLSPNTSAGMPLCNPDTILV